MKQLSGVIYGAPFFEFQEIQNINWTKQFIAHLLSLTSLNEVSQNLVFYL
jgi:hypothetical protein